MELSFFPLSFLFDFFYDIGWDEGLIWIDLGFNLLAFGEDLFEFLC